MRRFIKLLLLLTLACGGPAITTHGPVEPGTGEEMAVGVADDELGSLYVWAMGDAGYLEVSIDLTVCKPRGGGCYERIERCKTPVHTNICGLDSLTDDSPTCVQVTLHDGVPVRVPIGEPYGAVLMVEGICLDATRESDTSLLDGQWWRMPYPDHPRGYINPMAGGGGSPQRGANKVFYGVPTGGPR